jgi:hypothetical protein
MCSCPWLYSPKFWARLAINFSRWPYWIECGGKVDAFIDSENTYALPAKIPWRVSLAAGTNFWGILAKACAGFVGNPTGRRQRCRVRHRLGRLLVNVTYKHGTK